MRESDLNKKKSMYPWRNAVFKCQSQLLIWIICIGKMQDTLNCHRSNEAFCTDVSVHLVLRVSTWGRTKDF